MKKKLLSLLLCVSISVALISCGNDKVNTDTTQQSEATNSESEEMNESQTAEESEAAQENEATEIILDDGTGMTGTLQKIILSDEEDWFSNTVHVNLRDEDIMNFVFKGPANIGYDPRSGETTLFLYETEGDSLLLAWGAALTEEDDRLKN